MKKLFLLSILMLLPLLASADAVEIDGIYYNLIEKARQAEVIQNPNKYSGSVVIPESVVYDGITYSVTSIGECAFANCSSLTSVTIPNSVTSIGSSAFSGCSGLTSVTIPNSVTSIGRFAFENCKNLTSVHITDIAAWCNIKFDYDADNPLRYAGHLYLNGKEVRDLVIPNNVISIGSYAFYGYSGLTSVTIPNSVTSIGEQAFSRCSALTSVNVESGNPKYDSRNNCNAIIETSSNTLIAGCQSTIIPNTVTSIGGNAFRDCRGLTSVTIPNSVTSIGEWAFAYCSGLTSVTIPNSVTSIGKEAFISCRGLTSVTIPNSVTSIGDWAFYNCSGLTSITIGNSVTSIGSHAFAYCSGLTSVTIPNSVTSIREFAFRNCSGLTSVTIGNSAISFRGGVFEECTALQYIKSYITEPYSINKTVFPEVIYRQSTLYVPAGTEKLYSRYDGWREFLKIVEMDGTEVPDIPGADKCATPTISYQFGQLSFSCETEGVTFVSEITDYDIKKSYDASLYLTATYYISVYATKDGYNNSDVATATLSWIDVEPKTEGITNNVVQVRAKAVLIQSSVSMLSIAGVDGGTAISVYDVSGKMVGSATAASENTNISTSLRPGDIALVKIGSKTVKVVIK